MKDVSAEPHGDSTAANARGPLQVRVGTPAFLVFPTIGHQGPEYRLSEAQIAEWGDLFPGLDVRVQARAALAWVKADPGRRKTVRGMPKFLVGWFAREVNSGRRGGLTQAPAKRLDDNGLTARSNEVLAGLGRRKK